MEVVVRMRDIDECFSLKALMTGISDIMMYWYPRNMIVCF